MLSIVLGAPGSGKSAVTGRLRTEVHRHVVIDWDDYMPSVAALAGRDVRRSPDLWEPYGRLVRDVVRSLGEIPTVVFTVCTPAELIDWPEAHWILLDCSDDERRRRLATRDPDVAVEALSDAEDYRRLGLPVIDTTDKTIEDVTNALTERVL